MKGTLLALILTLGCDTARHNVGVLSQTKECPYHATDWEEYDVTLIEINDSHSKRSWLALRPEENGKFRCFVTSLAEANQELRCQLTVYGWRMSGQLRPTK